MADQPTRHELELRRVATLERCPICDRPSGDEMHIDQCEGCDDLCWSKHVGKQISDCRAHAVDWRARALAAEARVAALTDAARELVDAMDRDVRRHDDYWRPVFAAKRVLRRKLGMDT